MKKLVILYFLFLGGVCLEVGTSNVYAASLDSESSIYFTDTYVYTPALESGNINGVTPTGNPPWNRNQELPKAGESSSRSIQMVGILLFISSMILTKYWKKELDNENN